MSTYGAYIWSIGRSTPISIRTKIFQKYFFKQNQIRYKNIIWRNFSRLEMIEHLWKPSLTSLGLCSVQIWFIEKFELWYFWNNFLPVNASDPKWIYFRKNSSMRSFWDLIRPLNYVSLKSYDWRKMSTHKSLNVWIGPRFEINSQSPLFDITFPFQFSKEISEKLFSNLMTLMNLRIWITFFWIIFATIGCQN